MNAQAKFAAIAIPSPLSKVMIGVLSVLRFLHSSVRAQTRLTPADKGEHLYQRNCLRCHGSALDGKGPDTAALSVPPVNFRTYLSRLKDDAEFERTIKVGKRFLGMHSWEDMLTDEQVRDLIAYIRSAAPHAEVIP